MKVTYESGLQVQMGVRWDAIDPRDLAQAGTHTVNGVLANGQKITATLILTEATQENFQDLQKNLLLWFDASDLAAGPVAEWTAKIPGGVTAKQQKQGAQPQAVAGQDGKTVAVHFDGDDMLNFSMQKDTFNNRSGLTAVIYAEPEMNAPSGIQNNHNSSVLYFGEYAPGWSGMYVGAYRNGATGRFGTGEANYRGVLYNGGNYSGYTTTVLAKDGKTIDALTVNDQKITDVETDRGNAYEQTRYIDATQGQLGSGKRATGWKGNVKEILVFDRALNNQELEAVYRHLGENETGRPVDVSGIYLKEADSELTLYNGDQKQLTACVMPVDAAIQDIKWTSSAPEVVEVDAAGLVTAKGEGYAVITAETVQNGFKARCTVRVNQAEKDRIWEDITQLLGWVEQNEKDSDRYNNWSGLKTVADKVKKLSPDSSVEQLRAAYYELRDARLALEVKKLTVTFKTGCSTQVDPVQVTYGQTVAPVEVQRPDYELIGWYAGNKKYDFNTPVTADLTLTAKWKSLHPSAPVVPDRPVEPEKPVNPFVDVKENNYFFKPVLWAVENKITAGVSATEFGPDVNCTRGQIVTFLWNAAGKPQPAATASPFVDVKEGDWYYKAVLWAAEKGITAGVSENEFGPGLSCTRSQAMTFLWKYMGRPAAAVEMPFTDVARGSWFYEPVKWAVANGITAGTSQTTFGSNDGCTRAQIVTFLYRALNK